MATALLNARVEETTIRQARDVLESRELSLSYAVRTTLEYIARTGHLPVDDAPQDGEHIERVEHAMDFFDSPPLPELREGWGDVELDRQMLGDERVRRFG